MPARELAQQLKTRFGDLISEPAEFRGEITVQLSDAGLHRRGLRLRQKAAGFDFLVDVSSIDNYGTTRAGPWFIIFTATGIIARLRLKTDVSEEKSELPTVTVWKTADWHEREIYDMMGIRFRNHPDLRRILMWDGYPYFPLRKDFPLAGKPSDVPEVAFTKPAPLEGGPFVTVAGGKDRPRANRACGPEPGKMEPRHQGNSWPYLFKTLNWQDSIPRPRGAARAADSCGELQDIHGEKMVLNMGPSHPPRTACCASCWNWTAKSSPRPTPDIGYLHRGDEKIAENMTYNQFIPYTDRLDYLAPLANNVAYALAVEKLLGIERLPPRCQYIRVICCELARISAHLLGLGAFAMDVGRADGFSVHLHRARKNLQFDRALTGARFTTSYTRIGGVIARPAAGLGRPMPKFLAKSFPTSTNRRNPADAQPHLCGSHRDVGHFQGRRRLTTG
jgi:NADH:ubiquinone oxidoreductase subunit C